MSIVIGTWRYAKYLSEGNQSCRLRGIMKGGMWGGRFYLHFLAAKKFNLRHALLYYYYHYCCCCCCR